MNLCLDRPDLLEGGGSPTRTKFLRRNFPTNGTSPCPSAASVSSGGPARVWLSWPLVDISQHLDFQGRQARALGAHFHSQARSHCLTATADGVDILQWCFFFPRTRRVSQQD